MLHLGNPIHRQEVYSLVLVKYAGKVDNIEASIELMVGPGTFTQLLLIFSFG